MGAANVPNPSRMRDVLRVRIEDGVAFERTVGRSSSDGAVRFDDVDGAGALFYDWLIAADGELVGARWCLPSRAMANRIEGMLRCRGLPGLPWGNIPLSNLTSTDQSSERSSVRARLRYDGRGPGHFNRSTGVDVPTPHMHDRSTPGGVRPVEPPETPRGGP